jgi:hypothetical protein
LPGLSSLILLTLVSGPPLHEMVVTAMDTHRPVVLLELNELTPSIMDRFIAEGRLPNFKRLRDRSEVFVTDAEERPPYLEPWIQWVTVHTGVPYSEHGVLRLSEGHKASQKRIWDLVSQAGGAVWVCGSMNCRYDPDTRGWILPDPWSTDVVPYPDILLPYYSFVQRNVHEYTQDRVPLSKTDYLNFIRFMVANGLSATTTASTVRQLIAEKKAGGGRWRRAFILEELQFDLFSAVYRRLKPRFSTFFLNSTAHMQHRYWRFMEPELFRVPVSEEKQREYQSAILEGYQAMDKLVGRMLKLVGQEAVIVMATALSQQSCLEYEETGGKRGYRAKNFSEVINFAGITTPHRVSPVMSEQFWIHFDNISDVSQAQKKLEALQVNGQKALTVKPDGSSIFAFCCLRHEIAPDTMLQVADSDRGILFFELFYAMEGGKSGMHHPDGMLWIRHPERTHVIHSEKVGLRSIAPTILETLDIEKPEYMKGLSLFPLATTPVGMRDLEVQRSI